MTIRRVCVYCASSTKSDPSYVTAARRLGECLSAEGLEIVYGGGAVGLMGALAEGVLAAGGRIVGVIPRFMMEREWGHTGLTELQVVETMHERKERMLTLADGFVALPGGCGTFEEVMEAITWKRLGLHTGPIVIASWNGFYDPLLALLERAVAERFMDARHADMWSVARTVEEVIPRLRDAPPWSEHAIDFAAV